MFFFPTELCFPPLKLASASLNELYYSPLTEANFPIIHIFLSCSKPDYILPPTAKSTQSYRHNLIQSIRLHMLLARASPHWWISESDIPTDFGFIFFHETTYPGPNRLSNSDFEYCPIFVKLEIWNTSIIHASNDNGE
jgi:hypothetical protein